MRYDEIIDVRLLPPAATLLAIIVSILLWILNQRVKQIAFRVLRQVGDKALVQIENSGHISVTPNDYHSPLSIRCGPGAQVVSARIVATSPGDLEDRCRTAGGDRRSLVERVQGDEVTIAPVLLNEGDSITVEVEAREMRGGVKVSAHINGIRKVGAWRPKTLVASMLRVCGVVVMISSLFVVPPADMVKYGFFEALPAILFFLFGCTLFAAGIYDRRNRVKMEPAV